MASRKGHSYGQRVKTFQHYIPTLDPTAPAVKEIVVVYFSADGGDFTIPVPEHIGNLLGTNKWTGYGGSKDYHDSYRCAREAQVALCRSKIMDTAIAGFEEACREFSRVLRQQNKKRVIRVRLHANPMGTSEYVWDQKRFPVRLKDIGFTGNPALHISYTVCWQVGDRLYETRGREGDPFTLHDIGPAGADPNNAKHGYNNPQEHFVVDWTEEREAAIKGLYEGFGTLIERIIQFVTQDMAQKLDALAHSGGGLLAIAGPAPQVGREEEIEHYISSAVSPQEAYAVIDGEFVERDVSVPQVRTRTRRRGPV